MMRIAQDPTLSTSWSTLRAPVAPATPNMALICHRDREGLPKNHGTAVCGFARHSITVATGERNARDHQKNHPEWHHEGSLNFLPVNRQVPKEDQSRSQALSSSVGPRRNKAAEIRRVRRGSAEANMSVRRFDV